MVALREGELVFFRDILVSPVAAPTHIHLDSPNWTQRVLKKKDMKLEEDQAPCGIGDGGDVRNGDDGNSLSTCAKLPRNKNKKFGKCTKNE